MEFLAPWSLLGLGLVPAIFLWGLWAPRGQRVVVGSLLLWRRVVGTGPTGRPSPRLRLRNPLLWMDAAAILLVVVACARPAIHRSVPEEPVATVVIDRSAGMLTETPGRDDARFHRPRAMLAELLRPLGDAPLRVVEVPGDAGVDVSARMTAAELLAAVAPWQPVLAARDVWPVAVSEAAAHRDTPVLVATAMAPTMPVPSNVYVFAPGAETANAAIVRAATRIEGDRWWLLVAARAAAGARGPYALGVYANDANDFEVPAFLAPGGTAERVFPMKGPPAPSVAVELAGPNDGFLWDNRAFLAWEPARGLRVLLVGQADEALRRALAARDETSLFEMAAPAEVKPDDADLVVATGVPIPDAWKGPAVLVMPPAGAGPVTPLDSEAQAEWKVVGAHPLAEALYLEPPRIGGVRRYRLEAGAELVLGTPDAPLAATWAAGGQKRLAILFPLDTKTSDWTRGAGFPVFWRRALDWLAPQAGRGGRHATYLPLETPPGSSRPVAARPGFGISPDGRRTGVSFIGTDAGFESGPGRDDSPRALAALRVATSGRKREEAREIWPWLAGAVLALVLARAWVGR